MKICDMHCDTISVLLNDEKEGKNSSLRENDHHLDLRKMQKGDYLLQNFAMFTPLVVDDPMYYCQKLIDKYYREIEANEDLIRPVYSYSDIEKNINEGLMSAMLTLEEGAVIHDDLAILRLYHRLGVRMITLTWNYPNGIGYPNFDNSSDQDRYNKIRQINTKDGLTPFGIEYIKEMERLGIIIDVSHLGDAGFYDVVKYSTKPFVASHSNARSICSVARNMTDDMIREVAKKGGVIGLNYCKDFVDDDGDGNIEGLIRHVDHIIKVGGEDVIGLGSDFDGIGDRSDLKNGSEMQDLVKALKDHGYSDKTIAKITHENVLRVYKEVLR